MRSSKLIALLVTASMLAACTEPDGSPARGLRNGGRPDNEEIGAAVGVIGGGVIGSFIGGGIGRVATIVAGGLIGGALGDAVGKSLDNADWAAYNRTSQRSMESGRPLSWHNPDSGNSGTIVPRREYVNEQGQNCREYTQTIMIGGKSHTGHGTACRGGDGQWHIVH